MLKTTPFHERTAPLCASHAWRRWAGHVVASSYELTHEREYHVIRTAAALFDVSPLYKYMVRGRDAGRLLDLVVTRNVQKAAVGQVLYTPWCDHAGKVMDDGTVARLNDTTFRMTSAEPNLRWLQDNAAGLEVDVTDVTGGIAALSLQGPAAGSILMVTTAGDMAVNNAATQAVVRHWRKHARAKVREHTFGPELGNRHDIIGPYQPDARVDYVYPILFDLVDSRA